MASMQFGEQELVALRLGARLVKGWADRELAQAAESALARIEQALPEGARDHERDEGLLVPDYFVTEMVRRRVGEIRLAVAEKRRTWLRYRSAGEEVTERVVRPVALFFWGGSWAAGAWCELRTAFRDFRLDRMVSLRLLEDVFTDAPGQTLQDYLERLRIDRDRAW
jgi:predicted DNA-binding transcriptional regulator YafY